MAVQSQWLTVCLVLATTAFGLGFSKIYPLASTPVNIAAFNVRVLGTTKIKDLQVLKTVAKVIKQYDIILIQEIRDKDNKVIPAILKEVTSPSTPFNVAYSQRLGRTASKEQYAFFYRTDKLNITDTYQYPDAKDYFQREPFVVRINTKDGALKDFAMLGLHTDPQQVIEELRYLPDVVTAIEKHWKIKNIIIAGDLNAGCDYAKHTELNNLILGSDPKYQWLIDYSVDTTATNTYCSYDRFILVGSDLRKAYVENSATLFPFDAEYGLTELETLAVSDHYPIHFQLSGIVNKTVQSNIGTVVSYTVEDKRKLSDVNLLRNVYRKKDSKPFLIEQLKVGSKIAYVKITRSRIFNPVSNLQQLQTMFPGLLSDEAVSMVSAYHEAKVLYHNAPVYGVSNVSQTTLQTVSVSCSFADLQCTITVETKLTA